MVSNVTRAAEAVHWKCEAKEGFIHPYVIPSLPFSLWGRDIIEHMSVRLMAEGEEIFFLGAIVSSLYGKKISWKNDEPVCLNQWPLTTKKIQAIDNIIWNNYRQVIWRRALVRGMLPFL